VDALLAIPTLIVDLPPFLTLRSMEHVLVDLTVTLTEVVSDACPTLIVELLMLAVTSFAIRFLEFVLMLFLV